jgi:hypothetical protein
MKLAALREKFVWALLYSIVLQITFVGTSSWAMSTRSSVQKTCPNYQFSPKDVSLHFLNPPARVVRGVSLPGNGETLFRGATESNQQFDAPKAVRAMLGEPGWVLGSPLFWGITEILKGQWTLERPFLPDGGLPLKLGKYLELRKILDDVETLLQCRGNQFYSATEANDLAKDLTTKSFERAEKEELENRYLNLKYPYYYSKRTEAEGFGNNAADFVTASYNDQIASIYGKKVLVLKQKNPRGVDLGFWNSQHNNYFWDGWVDNGEIDIPGFIDSSDINGYQVRADDRSKADWGTLPPNNPIQYAFYKMTFSGRNVVAVVSGMGKLCLAQDEKLQKIYFCKSSGALEVTKDITPGPTPRSHLRKDLAPLIGIIAACAQTDCPDVKQIFKYYNNPSARGPNESMLALVKNITVKGKQVQFLRPTQEEMPKPAKIKVLSATYTLAGQDKTTNGNVTTQAARYCDGKESVQYKVSHRFLDTPADARPKSFAIEWICSGENKKRSMFEPAPAEDKTLQINCEDE